MSSSSAVIDSQASAESRPLAAGGLVDARTVGRALRAGNHAEQAASQVLPHGVEIRQHRHNVNGTGKAHRRAKPSADKSTCP